MSEEKGELKGMLIGLMLGAAVGTVLGILIAPASGSETRQKLKTALEDIPENVRADLQFVFVSEAAEALAAAL